MRKLPLYVSLVTMGFAPIVSFAEVHDARAMARGGVGLTMGEYNQSLKNPALLSSFDKDDDFSFALNVGVFASDKDGMIQKTDDVQTAIDDLEAGHGSANAVNQAMKELDKKLALVDVGGAVLIAIPNKHIPLAFMTKSNLSFGTVFNYNPTDFVQLNSCVAGLSCNLNNLQSTVNASAIGITEAGLMFGKPFENGLEVGLTLKGQQIDLISYSATVTQFDTADISDSNDLKTHNNVNMDIGGIMRFGAEKNFSVAATVENLIGKTFEGPKNKVTGINSEYDLAPVAVAAVGYSNNYFKIEANTDLTPRKGFDKLLETQFTRVGMELSAGRHFHLRAGYRTDSKSNVSDVVTAGIGITPFDRLNIDIAAMLGDGDTAGVGLQLGFKI
ncbi:MAG: conjugal transfer protein TraF [Agitococcus sp.]|nr:conjugal transfer protein TraF [Agitococcus sp.]